MSLENLMPLNTRQARETAVRRFKRFLAPENVELSFIRPSLFVKLTDRWALYLAFANGRGGNPLACNTVMSYYHHVKNWLLGDFPQHCAVVERQLFGMTNTLDRNCAKKRGTIVKKAPACTKEDLRLLVDGIYFDATSPKNYQDALVVLMWYALEEPPILRSGGSATCPSPQTTSLPLVCSRQDIGGTRHHALPRPSQLCDVPVACDCSGSGDADTPDRVASSSPASIKWGRQ